MTAQPQIPVVLVRGFLDSGKTTWIHRLLEEKAPPASSILLISCEAGETPYDPKLLKRARTALVELEGEDSMNREYFQQLSSQFAPDLVIIECNAMWKLLEFELPQNWKVEQRIALLSGETLELYLDNMRSLMGPMLSRCDQILINRCPAPESLSTAKGKLRPLLSDPSVVRICMPEEDFSLDAVPDLVPYPLEGETISIPPQHYVYWYYDCQDHPIRYEGRKLSLYADVKKSPILSPKEFALGRISITCCEADMSFLGYLAHYENIDELNQYTHVRAEATVEYRMMKQYGRSMPYLQVLRMEAASPAEQIASY